MLITNTITMAIDRQQMPPVIDAVQGDANSRAIKIKLTNGGKPWNVPDGASCLVRFGKPDKTGGIYDTLEDGSSAALFVDGYLQIVLAKQVVSVPGNVFLQVEITSNEASLATFAIIVRVQEDPSIGTMESEDYINLSGYVLDEVHRILKEGGFGGSGTFWVHATLDYEAGTAEVVESAEEIYAAYEANMNCCMRATVTNPVTDAKQILILQTAEKSPTANGTHYRIAFHQLSSYEERSEGTGEWVTRAVLDEVVVSKFDDEIQNVCFRTRVLTDDDQTGIGSALTIDEQTYDGSENVDMTPAVEAVAERKMMSVKRAGTKGDGETDDTAAFQKALSENRIVYVPGGTYKLSGELVIGENCGLILSQDTVLNFTQTSGNCITLGMSSSLKGNHATVNVPYAFSGNVVYASSTTTEDTSAPPPFTRWSPQWKSGRYVSDLNICKADNRGFHYSVDGKCNGTAVYLSADGNAHLTFMWGVHYTGLRIAGAFTYGVRAVNFNEGWLHEMRIDAFIDGCETGVSLEDCNNAYVSAIIEPRRALLEDNKTYVPYAKHGIKLIRSKNADLSGSRVWDWDATNTLWTAGGEYQHLCMYGECRGAIINAFQYYETSYDIRDLIYTDTASNLEQITILQEPFDRWFKNRGNEPYFFDGYTEKKLATQDELDQHFTTDRVKGFTDVLATAIGTDGTIYNGIGYRIGCRLDGYDVITESPYYGVTGFIPCKVGSKIYAADLSWANRDGYCRVNFYGKDLNMLMNGEYGVSERAEKIVAGSSSLMSYEETSNGFVCTVLSVALTADVAYVRFTFRDVGFGAKPTMAVDEEIRYTVEGFLADGIRVKAENVVGDVGSTTPDWNAAEGEAGHIKGRTHYHKDGAIIMPKTTCEVSEGMADATLNAPFVADKTYRVIFNGQQYYCTAKLTEGNVYIGNNALVEAEGDTGEPFVIIPTDLGELGYAGVIILADATATECTLSIVEIEYITLPVEYLPSTHQRYIVNVPEGEVDTSSTIWGLSENSDNVAPIIYGGGDVLLKIVNISGAVSFYQLLSPSIASGVVVGFVAKDGRTLSSVTFAAGTWTPPTT